MGFLNAFWEAFIQATTYAHMLGMGHGFDQLPLDLPALGQTGSGHDRYNPNVGHDAAVVGPSFQPVPGNNFTCDYSAMIGYTACNTASDRTCWLESSNPALPGFNITTDYENHSPVGITREYWLQADLQHIAPDGFVKKLGLVFNGTMPGPELQACWGDVLKVHVTNKIPDLGTTVHWHGIRQLHTNQQDGVNGVTQCPIAYNQTYTYIFNVSQYGHSWYHAHYQTEYSDGLQAPLTLYGPSSASWDLTERPIHMSDWVHENTSIAFQEELAGGIVVSDSLLFNGTGSFKCSDLDPLCCSQCSNVTTAKPECAVDPALCCTPSELCFFKDASGDLVQATGGPSRTLWTEGKKYLLKLTNSAAEAMFIFQIDNHNLTVIQTDLVPIKPFVTDSIFIGIGQRYEVIVTAEPNVKSPECIANSANCNYWIRTRIATGCGTTKQDDETTGVVVYNPTVLNNVNVLPTTFPNTPRDVCQDEDPTSLVPMYPWNVTPPINNREKYTFEAGISDTPFQHAFRWDLTNEPLFVNYSSPTIFHVANSTYLDTTNGTAIANYTFVTESDDDFVYLVINGNFTNTVKRPIPAAHPIHLHGHDFVILAQEDQTFNGTIPPYAVSNPARRDVALLYTQGYLALAFKLGK